MEGADGSIVAIGVLVSPARFWSDASGVGALVVGTLWEGRTCRPVAVAAPDSWVSRHAMAAVGMPTMPRVTAAIDIFL